MEELARQQGSKENAHDNCVKTGKCPHERYSAAYGALSQEAQERVQRQSLYVGVQWQVNTLPILPRFT